ncbi:MAG: UDP-N-acetylmuramate--L-alanine ligase [Bacillota bacterium]
MEYNHIHLIGIGGISMSGISQILAKEGYKVSGSDLNQGKMIDKLINMGIEVSIGHNKDNVKGADLVVYSSAIPEDNVEIEYARENNVPIMKRAQFIAKLMGEKKGIAISGTHGKTTTTALISSLFKKGGMDPTILVGGELGDIGNSYRGTGEYFITEADESDGSFLYFDPEIIVVTNIELDHHSYYNNKQELLNIFEKFISKVPDRGKAILCSDDKYLNKLIQRNNFNMLDYGINSGTIRAVDINLLPFGSYFTVKYNQKKLGEINLQIPGIYNIKNSLAAIATGMFVGFSFGEIKNIIETFTGVKRRFEKKGLIDDILVIDDYAHHPTEIIETLKAAKNTGYNRVVAVFQPHLYSRTKHLLKEFSESFDLVDKLIVTDIYGAREDPVEGVHSKKLVEMIQVNSDIDVKYIQEFDDIVFHLKKILKPKDLLLTVGAGDVYKIGERLLSEVKDRTTRR